MLSLYERQRTLYSSPGDIVHENDTWFVFVILAVTVLYTEESFLATWNCILVAFTSKLSNVPVKVYFSTSTLGVGGVFGGLLEQL